MSTPPLVLARWNMSLALLLPSWAAPLWRVVAAALVVLAGLWLVDALLRSVVPNIAAIARTTAKEVFYQPLVYVLMALGVFALILSDFLPYNTFGEDIKMVKDQGVTLIMILSVILAAWTAGSSVADEIEGRTALTLLSKPVSRRQFILGKFLGVIIPVAMMFIVLGVVFMACVSYKAVYDAKESALPDPGQAECVAAMVQIVPALLLSFMEAVILTAISVAISTRLALLPNFLICFSIYVLGHLVPLLLESASKRFEIVGFVARLFGNVLPMLDHFNIQAAISTGDTVPADYLWGAAAYCVLYTTVAMLVGLLLFEDRDLA